MQNPSEKGEFLTWNSLLKQWIINYFDGENWANGLDYTYWNELPSDPEEPEECEPGCPICSGEEELHDEIDDLDPRAFFKFVPPKEEELLQ